MLLYLVLCYHCPQAAPITNYAFFHVVWPFLSSCFSTGEYKSDSRKDTYNFFLSQLRIRIEMAFGMLTSKFQILKKPLQVKIRNAGKVFLVCARLHNFIINERIAENGDNCDKLFAYNGDDEEGDHTFF